MSTVPDANENQSLLLLEQDLRDAEGQQSSGGGGDVLTISGSPPPDASLGLWGQALSGHFYPQLAFDSGSTINFVDPANLIVIDEVPVGGQNTSLNGNTETLQVRNEPRVTLTFQALDGPTTTAVRDWWRDWAMVGKQTALVLDRFGTCSGQWEFDAYNTFFTRAICLRNPFSPRRLAPKLVPSLSGSRMVLVVTLAFKQDSVTPVTG